MTKTATETKNVPAKAPLVASRNAIVPIVPQNVEQAYRVATIIAQADMAPKAYSRDINKIMVGIMAGMEVGFAPMAALQSIAVINGTPTIWGDGAMALVESTDQLEDKKEWIEGEGEERVAYCEMKRKGRETPIKTSFSWAQAALAGLTQKTGPWKTYPDRMLQMRARLFCIRDGFADALRGVKLADVDSPEITLEAGANGVYAPARPERADFDGDDTDDVLTRAVEIAERDGISLDEARERALEEEAEAQEPEPGDPDAAQPDEPVGLEDIPAVLDRRPKAGDPASIDEALADDPDSAAQAPLEDDAFAAAGAANEIAIQKLAVPLGKEGAVLDWNAFGHLIVPAIASTSDPDAWLKLNRQLLDDYCKTRRAPKKAMATIKQHVEARRQKLTLPAPATP